MLSAIETLVGAVVRLADAMQKIHQHLAQKAI
jgi:hypothetical protein